VSADDQWLAADVHDSSEPGRSGHNDRALRILSRTSRRRSLGFPHCCDQYYKFVAPPPPRRRDEGPAVAVAAAAVAAAAAQPSSAAAAIAAGQFVQLDAVALKPPWVRRRRCRGRRR
jgi:hypothetical protein